MTLLGKDAVTGKDVTVSMKDRLTSMYVIGATGTGKTTFLNSLIVQDIEAGMGICCIEPHQDLTDYILASIPDRRIDEVILCNPLDEEPFGLNIYECPDITDPRMVAYTLNMVMDTFEKLYDMSRSTPRMAQVMRNLALLLIHNPGMTMLEIPLILSDAAFRHRLVANTPPYVQPFWKRYDLMSLHEQRELTDSTSNKIDEFIIDPIARYIFGQSTTTIHFREVMDTGKILLVSLDASFPVLSDLVGSILVNQLLIATLSRRDVPQAKRRQYNLYIDEFQNYATPSMNVLLTECRKYRVASTVSHQSREQQGINDTIRATTKQAGSLVVFRVTAEDADVMAPEFSLEPQQAVRPPGTIPANVLPRLETHPHEAVKDFWRQYVVPLDQALTKHERYEHESYMNIVGDTVRKQETIYPEQDFGLGTVVEYDRAFVEETRNLLNNFLYETLVGKRKQDELYALKVGVIRKMATLLQFVDYYNFFYARRKDVFTAKGNADLKQEIDQYTDLKNTLCSFQTNDEGIMRFFVAWTHPPENIGSSAYTTAICYNPLSYLSTYYEVRKKNFNTPDQYSKVDRQSLPALLKAEQARPLEETKRLFQEKVAEFQALAARHQSVNSYLEYYLSHYRNMLEKIRPEKLAALQEDLQTGRWRKSWWEKLTESVNEEASRLLPNEEVDLHNYHSPELTPFRFHSTIAQATQGLRSVETFLQLIATDTSWQHSWFFDYRRRTSEEIVQGFAERCEEVYSYCEPRNTSEKLLAATRSELQTEIDEVEEKLQSLLTEQQWKTRKEQEMYDRWKEEQKALHDAFVSKLDAMLSILVIPQYRIEVSPATWNDTIITQQSYSDRQKQLANELVNPQIMRVGIARVRIPTGEYLIRSILPNVGLKTLAAKKAQVVEHTRRTYCTPRAVVEEHIRARQTLDTPPTQRTQRI